jgi:nucleotide-binding universal stress UspA family protein
MHCILIPVDGSESALKAVKHAIAMVHDGYAAYIHILYVIPLVFPMDEMQPPDYSLIEKAQKQQAQRILDSVGKLLDDAGIEYTRHMEEGPVSARIVDWAHSRKCDGIIMGTRGMSALGNWILGSTASQVVHLADIPVTLVK